MFNVETEKYGEVKVSFRHNNPGKPLIPGFHFGTYCSLSADDETVSFGSAEIENGVQLNKDCGRKAALADAMKTAEFDRDQRILFWRQYFATQGKEIVIA